MDIQHMVLSGQCERSLRKRKNASLRNRRDGKQTATPDIGELNEKVTVINPTFRAF